MMNASKIRCRKSEKTLVLDAACLEVTNGADWWAVANKYRLDHVLFKSALYRRCIKHSGQRGFKESGELDNQIVAPDREPCWRCGIRGDIGCAHQRHAA